MFDFLFLYFLFWVSFVGFPFLDFRFWISYFWISFFWISFFGLPLYRYFLLFLFDFLNFLIGFFISHFRFPFLRVPKDHFMVEDSNDEIYSSYGVPYSSDYSPKWWKCVFDHVQIFYGSKSTGDRTDRLCQIRDSLADEQFIWNNYENYPGGNPTDLGYFNWTKINYSNLEINFVTDTYANSFGFKLQWRCAQSQNYFSFFATTFIFIIALIAVFIKLKNRLKK